MVLEVKDKILLLHEGLHEHVVQNRIVVGPTVHVVPEPDVSSIVRIGRVNHITARDKSGVRGIITCVLG
jgi:hypothetical protein